MVLVMTHMMLLVAEVAFCVDGDIIALMLFVDYGGLFQAHINVTCSILLC